MKKMVIEYKISVYMDDEYDKLSWQDQERHAYGHAQAIRDAIDKEMAQYDKDRVYFYGGSYNTDVDESELKEQLESKKRLQELQDNFGKEEE